MALNNNLVLAKEDHAALAEALAERQPGDKLTLTLEVTLVENLKERATFDVDAVESVAGADRAEAAEESGEDAVLKDSVLGVMSKKKGA